MAEKLDSTPDGVICKVCGEDKQSYHYFKHAGKYTQDFFTTELGYTPGVCWECAGDYRCITCHEIKPASEFRVQGRLCASCKTRLKELATMARATPSQASKNDFDAFQDSVGVDSAETLKSYGWGE